MSRLTGGSGKSSIDEVSTAAPALTRDFSVSTSIDDDLAGSSSASKGGLLARNGGMILLLIVVAVAGALLMGMRQLGLAGRLELVDIKIDYPFDSDKQMVVTSDHQKVIDDLRSSSEVVQVPPELVQMNPFEWMEQQKSAGIDPEAAAREADRLRREKLAEKRAIDSAFAKLKLNSIMGGTVKVANISGDLVKVGDFINGMFKVTAIEGRSVTLMIDQDKYVMVLGE